MADSDLLPLTVPRGRIPRDFAQRCLAEARRRKAALLAESEALRVAERLGTSHDLERRTLARLAKLASRYPGEPEEGLAPGELAIPGTALLVDRRGRVRLRDAIPGTRILLGSDRERTGARRLGLAVAIVEAAWPEAGAEIRARTRLVVPAQEPGLVSYSLLSRPGVSFINLRGKTLLDLADDLLHETAHHRLHAIEDTTPLFVASGDPAGGEEPRYFSPWRRMMRPVRGIYHAAYTFAFRAELFRRILRAARGHRGIVGPIHVDARRARRLREEARKETRRLGRSLRDLEDAAERDLLTRAGRRLLLRIRAAT